MSILRWTSGTAAINSHAYTLCMHAMVAAIAMMVCCMAGCVSPSRKAAGPLQFLQSFCSCSMTYVQLL